MVNGSFHIKALFFVTDRKGRISAKYYEDGYSQVQPLNTQQQRENAFKQAISNAGHKFAYHSNQKYDDVEYNYSLISSEIVEVQPRTNKRYKRDDKLTRQDKLRLHREIKQNVKEKIEINDEKITSKEIVNMTAQSPREERLLRELKLSRQRQEKLAEENRKLKNKKNKIK